MAEQCPAHVPADRVADIDIYVPPGLEHGFHHAWSQTQAENPEIVWTPRNEGHWIALGGEALAEVQSDPSRFSSRVIVLPKSVGEQHALIPTTIDPPEHRPYRLLLNANLHPGAIRGLKEDIERVAGALIDGFKADGRCNFTAQYAEIFPIRIFMALVDLPIGDAETIRHWAACMTRPDGDMTFQEAKDAFYAYLGPILAKRAADPGEDLLSRMLQTDMGERRLGAEEAVSIATQTLIAGVDTVVNFLSFVMVAMAEDSALRARLRSEEKKAPAVNELFRRFGLVTIAREVRADTVFRGVAMKAGDMVAIPTQVHGLDPKLNDDPLTIDLDRPRPKHSAFGSGPHMCPGQELARAEVAATIGAWLARIPDFRVSAESDLSCVPGIVGSIRRLVLEWDVA
jgi:cytochrome P450